MNHAPGLHLQSVHITLGERTLVPALSLHVRPGEVAVVMGDSGSGKSSLLAWLAGVLAPPLQGWGSVWLGAEDVSKLPAEQRRMGLMLQDDVLFPHWSVCDNLLFALPRHAARGHAQRRALALQALHGAELGALAAHRPHQLSGGQRSRVALLRTLLAQPRAVLLDEPFSKLDAALRVRMRTQVWATLARAGLPALLVTHDPGDIPPGATVITLPSTPPEPWPLPHV